MAGGTGRVRADRFTGGRWLPGRAALAGLLSLVLTGSLVSVTPPESAAADPGRPAGASATRPKQGARAAELPSHEVSAASTSVPGATGKGSAGRKRPPGAVGAAPVFPWPVPAQAPSAT